MKLEQVLSKRSWKKDFFWKIVHEWEDEYAKALGIPIKNELPLFRDRMQKYSILKFFQSSKISLSFEMFGTSERINNMSNIIPIIIDLFPNSETLESLQRRYSENKCVLVSSKEAYEYLRAIDYPLYIYHHALSLPDKYRYNSNVVREKEFDIVFMGRPNPVLKEFVDKYISKHSSFKYVIKEPDSFRYYDSTGNFVAECITRKDYFLLMRKSRIALYATADMDNDRGVRSGFHHVTPRFLEMVSCGCHIILRYEKNPDTDYFNLDAFCPSIDSYEMFEKRMDECLDTQVDHRFYSEYLSKHYTSVRAKELIEILSNIK